jgi:hypothetical protein
MAMNGEFKGKCRPFKVFYGSVCLQTSEQILTGFKRNLEGILLAVKIETPEIKEIINMSVCLYAWVYVRTCMLACT